MKAGADFGRAQFAAGLQRLEWRWPVHLAQQEIISHRMLEKAASKAAASEGPRRTPGYVEGLNDARTRLADLFSILLGCLTLTADVPEERLQTGVLERLAEDERLCNWVVVRQPPGSQSDDVTRRFLSVGGCEEFGILWKCSKCERGDLGVGAERLKWCRSKDIDRGCPSEQHGQQVLEK